MARPLRIEYPNAVYHVTSRGNARNDIFLNGRDRSDFLNILESVVKRYNWLCHAYCLMDNHYHLLIETPDGNLSRGMRQLNGIYTQKYNWRHNKTGHLFQGRYKAILVDKDNYLLELCRYVVLNPHRAHLTEQPNEWSWSSYKATAGLKTVPEYLTIDWILSFFGKNKTEAQKYYRKFIREGIDIKSPWEELQGQILLGEESFIEKCKIDLSDKERKKEIPKSQRYLNRPQLRNIFVKVENKDERNKLIHVACVEYDYSMKEIADNLGIHYTTVSKVIKKLTKTNY
jgi:putative transposase